MKKAPAISLGLALVALAAVVAHALFPESQGRKIDVALVAQLAEQVKSGNLKADHDLHLYLFKSVPEKRWLDTQQTHTALLPVRNLQRIYFYSVTRYFECSDEKLEAAVLWLENRDGWPELRTPEGRPLTELPLYREQPRCSPETSAQMAMYVEPVIEQLKRAPAPSR